MLILCSDGLTNNKLRELVREKVKLLKTAALVITADNVYKENNYHIPGNIKALEMLGLQVNTFDIDTQPPEHLLNYDVVVFMGGNPFYLINSIREKKAENIIAKISQDKVLIGWSAAVFVFGPTLELVNRYSPEMNFLNLDNLDGLSLTKIQVLPHYSRYIHKFDRFEEICAEYEKENSVSVIRLNDGECIFVDDDYIKIYN